MSENLKKIMVSSAALLMFASVGTAAVNSSAMNVGTKVNAASRVYHPAGNYMGHRSHVTARWNRTHAYKYILNGKRAVNTLPTPLRGERTVYTRRSAKGLRVRATKGETINHDLHYWRVSNRSGNVLGWVEAKGVSRYHAKHVSNNAKVVEANLAKVDFLAHDSVANNNSSEMKNARILLDKVDSLANTRAEKNEVKAERNNVRKVARNAKQERRNARKNALNSVPQMIADVRVAVNTANNINNRQDAHYFLDEATNILNKAQKAVNNDPNSSLSGLFNKDISAYSKAINSARVNADVKSAKADKANAKNKAKDAVILSNVKMYNQLSQQATQRAHNIMNELLQAPSNSKELVRDYNYNMNKAVAYHNAAKSISKQAFGKKARSQMKEVADQVINPTFINNNNA